MSDDAQHHDASHRHDRSRSFSGDAAGDNEPREGETPTEFWERRYGRRDRIWSGRPNTGLVDVVGELPPGAALDVGCGEGGDAVWLAGRGWTVTAVDISGTALDRVAAHAAEAGVADRVHTERHDLAVSFPAGRYDLVCASFLQTPMEFPRTKVLRRAAEAVADGGLLVIVEHGSAPAWSPHHDHDFPTAAQTLTELDLAPNDWRTDKLETPERTVTGPDGRTATITDNVIAVRRT